MVVGANPSRSLPAFFETAFDIPVERIPSPGFAYRNGRRVNLAGTLWMLARNAVTYRRSLKHLDAKIHETRPDLILNFLEPLAGVWSGLNRGRAGVPIIAIGHQFLLRHPSFVRVTSHAMDRFGLFRYVDTVGLNSNRLALSFYETDDDPATRTTICPPLLRKQLYDLRPTNEGHLLVYLLNYGYAPEIIRWAERRPDIPINCFYDKPGVPEEQRVGSNLTFHRLHGEKFLALMSSCRGVVCTAGFESISEAAYLGKPAMVVPVEGHIEQHLNAVDARHHGLALHRTRFELDDLLATKAGAAQEKFRNWVHRGETVLLRAMQEAVREARSKPVNPSTATLAAG